MLKFLKPYLYTDFELLLSSVLNLLRSQTGGIYDFMLKSNSKNKNKKMKL